MTKFEKNTYILLLTFLFSFLTVGLLYFGGSVIESFGYGACHEELLDIGEECKHKDAKITVIYSKEGKGQMACFCENRNRINK